MNDKFYFEFTQDIPKYIQLYNHIKNLIEQGKVEEGEKLPSIRSLAEHLKVNTATIINCYYKLEQEGRIIQKSGSGSYVKKRDDKRSYRKEYNNIMKNVISDKGKFIDFTGETFNGEFISVEAFKEVINEVIDRDGAEALIFREPQGYPGLRHSINTRYWNGELKEDNIIILSGAQQGIDIVTKALLNVNDGVMIEKPTYTGALALFTLRRTNLLEVLVLDEIDFIALEAHIKKYKIKCFYVMSYFQNPTGHSYSLDEKLKLINLAEKYDFFILEDDYMSEIYFKKNEAISTFKDLDCYDRVIYLKSFSKIFMPGIRLGYMIVPDKYKEILQNSKVNSDIATSSLMQRVMELYIEKGYWKDFMDEVRLEYSNRYKYFIDYLTKHTSLVRFKEPNGGINLYLEILEPSRIDSMTLFRKCAKKGVYITPGFLFYKNSKDGDKYFRINFSQTSNEDIEKGMDIILGFIKNSI